MKCSEIIEIIEQVYPKEAALSFDNVGLLAGSREQEVRRIYIALDATEEVIRAACEAHADMLITHHPLLFSPVKCVTDDDFIGKRIIELIRSHISYYAMHTNYDVLGMAALAEQILDIRDAEVLEVTLQDENRTEGIGRVGSLPYEMSLKDCSEYIKEKLKLPNVRVFGNPELMIKRIAVCPGSGKSEIKTAVEKQADVLVAGDFGHHDGLDALEQGVAVIDAGHYGTEYIFMEDMKSFLTERLESVEILTAPVKHPFWVV